MALNSVNMHAYYHFINSDSYLDLILNVFTCPDDDTLHKSKKEGKDQDSIQSNTTSDPGHPMGK